MDSDDARTVVPEPGRAPVRALTRICSIATLVAAMLLVFSFEVRPQTPADIPGYPELNDFDPREVILLPEYCRYTQLFRDRVPGGSNPQEFARWAERFGYNSWMTLHHYCFGRMRWHRATVLSRTQVARQFWLKTSVGEYDYVLRYAAPDLVLRPEILTHRAESLLKLGKDAEALRNLDEAIQVRPDYWPPYIVKGDYYVQNGNPAKAREVFEAAAVAAPESTTARSRLSELSAASSANARSSGGKAGRSSPAANSAN